VFFSAPACRTRNLSAPPCARARAAKIRLHASSHIRRTGGQHGQIFWISAGRSGSGSSPRGAHHPGRQMAVLHLERREPCIILESVVVSSLIRTEQHPLHSARMRKAFSTRCVSKTYREHYTRLWQACNIIQTRSRSDSSLRLSCVCDHSSAHPSLMLAHRKR